MRWVLALVVAGLISPSLATIYHWEDEHGVTHFGDTPPAGVDAQPYDLRRQSPGSVLDTGANGEPPPADEAAEADEEAAAGRDAGAEDEEYAAAIEEQCEVARQNAEVLSDPSVRRYRDEEGQAHVLTEEEREERLADARSFLEEFCE